MTDNITLWIFNVAILANVYSLYRFWRAMQAFTKAQLQLNEILTRAGYGESHERT